MENMKTNKNIILLMAVSLALASCKAPMATVIQEKMIESGIKNKIIVTIEGKGRILIDDDIVEKASNNTYREKEHSLITFEDKKIRIRAIGEGISIRLL